MTEEQKNDPDNNYYKTTWGVLVNYEYKEAFKNSYNKLSKEEKEKQIEQLKSLPNFNKDIFFEISGIDIEDSETEIPEYTIEQLQEKLWENFKIIK